MNPTSILFTGGFYFLFSLASSFLSFIFSSWIPPLYRPPEGFTSFFLLLSNFLPFILLHESHLCVCGPEEDFNLFLLKLFNFLHSFFLHEFPLCVQGPVEDFNLFLLKLYNFLPFICFMNSPSVHKGQWRVLYIFFASFSFFQKIVANCRHL